MLGLGSIGQLAGILETTPRRLYSVADNISNYVQFYELLDPARPKRKIRIVLNPTGELRRIQSSLLRGLFKGRLRPTPFSFGGVPGRNAVQNASQHLKSRFAYTTDIQNFFPTISAWRVRSMFESRLQCSSEVSQLLTKLCTYDGHLAQGLITSPVLADQAVRRVDFRIAGLCRCHQLIYTRFVDDVTVSGWFSLDMQKSGIISLVRRILDECGFQIAQHKEQAGIVSDGETAITGLRIVHGHLDPITDYVRRLEEQLETHHDLGLGREFIGPLFTRDQMRGRVEYVCAINPNRARALRQRLGVINWDVVKANAIDRRLMVCRKTLKPLGSYRSERPKHIDDRDFAAIPQNRDNLFQAV
jgi:RNA-directed DNA polymerase